MSSSSSQVEKSAKSTMEPAFWQSIRDADYAVPEGYSLTELTSELVEYLGSPNPVLRHTFGYSILGYWIERGVYSTRQLRELIMQMVGNLSQGLKERNTDSVFRRSFSALVLAEIVARDNHQPFLRETEIKNLLRWTIEYLLAERDLRGYTNTKGWAHAIAHTADLLRHLARNRYTDRDDLEQIMMAIAQRITMPVDHVFIHNEDEQLVLVVWAALARQELTMPFMINWLARCVQVTQLAKPDAPFDPKVHAATQNTRNFLRSLYFRIALNKKSDEWLNRLRPKVLAAVKAVSG